MRRGGRLPTTAGAMVDAFVDEQAGATRPVYLSIDKDAFAPDVAMTNWDQGTLSEAGGAAIVTALARRGIDALPLDPWYFPSDHEYRARLERHGFTVSDIRLIERPTPVPRELAAWLGTFAQSFLAPLEEAERAEVKAEVERDLAPILRNENGGWWVDYVRLRFAATRN